MQHHSTTASRIQSAQSVLTGVIPQLLGAALLGLVILYGVGFAHMPAAHDAAHDSRHSVAFPCH